MSSEPAFLSQNTAKAESSSGKKPARSHRIWVFISSVFAFTVLIIALLTVPPETYWPAVVVDKNIYGFELMSEKFNQKIDEVEKRFVSLEKIIHPFHELRFLEDKAIKKMLEVERRIASSRIENLNQGFLDRLSTVKLDPTELFSCLNERTLVVEDFNASFYFSVKEGFSFDTLMLVLPRVE